MPDASPYTRKFAEVPQSIRLTPWQAESLRAYCDRTGHKPREVIRRAVDEFLEKHNAAQPQGPVNQR